MIKKIIKKSIDKSLNLCYTKNTKRQGVIIMTKESIYKELRNYGEILDDREATTSFGFERMLRIKYEGKIYFVELLNGRVMRISED